MQYFDFHHHKREISGGIYNLVMDEPPAQRWFSAGIHPMEITENWQQKFEEINRKVLSSRCIAIGECGLDSRAAAPHSLQDEVFLKHLELAESLRKPLIIHCVRRHQDLIRLCGNAQVPLIVHGFNKKSETARALLGAGFYLSFGAELLRSVSLQEIFREISPDSFFLETDDSEIEIEEIYSKAAEIKQVTMSQINKQIFENLAKLKDE